MAPTWLKHLEAQWHTPARRAWAPVEEADDEAEGLAVTAKSLRRSLLRGEADFPTRYFALLLALAWELEPAAGEAIVRSALKRSGDDRKHARVMLVGARRFFGVEDFLALMEAPCLAGEGARRRGPQARAPGRGEPRHHAGAPRRAETARHEAAGARRATGRVDSAAAPADRT